MELKIVYMDPNDLTPYEGNARRHGPQDIEQIKASIAADGFNDPIGVWGEKNIIVEGHGRQIAAIEMGLKKVPVIQLDHLTDTQRREYAIRHNRTAELSKWEFAKLEEEIAALAIDGVDLSGLDISAGGLEFEAFDGDGDGGGSQISNGTKVRVVIGALMFDIPDPDHELYEKTKSADADIVRLQLEEMIGRGDIL